MSSDGQKAEQKLLLLRPSTPWHKTNPATLWVVCDGNTGMMYELDGKNFRCSQKQEAVLRGYLVWSVVQITLGNTTLNNELWGNWSSNRKVKQRLQSVVNRWLWLRLPGDSCLLIANNLPEMPSTSIAVQLDVVDVPSKKFDGTHLLPTCCYRCEVCMVDKNRTAIISSDCPLSVAYTNPAGPWMDGYKHAVHYRPWRARKTLPYCWILLRRAIIRGRWLSLRMINRLSCTAGSRGWFVWHHYFCTNVWRKAKQGRWWRLPWSPWNNIPNDAGFLYGIRDFIPTQGKAPVRWLLPGIKIFTANFTSELVSMDLNGKNLKKNGFWVHRWLSRKSGKGDMYFHDATICFQNWQSCATCHPNDAHMDGLNWDLLNDGMGNPKEYKTLCFHQTPALYGDRYPVKECQEVAVRSGWSIFCLWKGEEEIYESIDEYLKSLKPLPKPSALWTVNFRRKGKEVLREN